MCERQYNRMKRQSTDLEKICAKDTSDKGLLFKIYKDLLKFNSTEMKIYWVGQKVH